jgi:hypothetical protein
MKRVFILIALAAASRAATVDELKKDCAAFRAAFGFDTGKSCLADFFTLQPIHPIVKSIVPGGGVGVGLNYTLDSPRGEFHRIFTVDGAISFRGFWTAETKFTLTHPKFGGDWNTARDAFATHFYVRAQDLPRMAFYGIGQRSSESGVVDYSLRQTRTGVDAINPLAAWFGIGAAVEGIFPDVNGVHSSGVRSIDQFYSEATAPGLVHQPPFVHSEVFTHLHHADPFEFDWRIGYNFFHDTDTGHYSFRRFRADLKHNLYLERPGGQPRRDSVFSVRAYLSLADVRAVNAVPFYLQETLGGTDIDGVSALRGFRDYRFRAPNQSVIQMQYERRIYKLFGLLAFYDTGAVAVRRGDLSLGNWRHSFGFGANVWSGAKVVFRAYVGLGSGEGAHTFFGIPALPQ